MTWHRTVSSRSSPCIVLAQTARRVNMIVRSGGLANSMSRYLIRRIEENPAITLRTHTEITALEGEDHLERVRWRDNRSGASESSAIRHVFVMTGATPSTHWLDGCVVLDSRGCRRGGIDRSVFRASGSARVMECFVVTITRSRYLE